MKFGPVPVAEAEGGIARPLVRRPAWLLKKGTTLGPAEIAALTQAGIAEHRGRAASSRATSPRTRRRAELAARGGGRGRPRRSRLHRPRQPVRRSAPGVLVVDRDAIDRLNLVDEAITFATLPAYKPVVGRRDDRDGEDHPVRGRRDGCCDAALAVAGAAGAAHAGRALSAAAVGVVSTVLPGLKPTGDRQDPGGARAARSRPPGPRSARSGAVPHDARRPRRGASTQVAEAGAELADRVRRLRDRRPARRDPGGDRADRRRDRAFRHAGRSRQSAAARPLARHAGGRRAGLRALAQGERLRLGAAAACWPGFWCRARTSPAWASAAC